MADQQNRGGIQNLTNAGKGRPKGVPNRTTALLKDAILQAAEKAGGKDGLVGYLTEQAENNPGPFMALLGKVLPMQITGEDGGAIKTELVVSRLSEAALREIAGLPDAAVVDTTPHAQDMETDK